jgi:hypothetical protein
LNDNDGEVPQYNVLIIDDKTGQKYGGHTYVAIEVQDLGIVQASLEAEDNKTEEERR